MDSQECKKDSMALQKLLAAVMTFNKRPKKNWLTWPALSPRAGRPKLRGPAEEFQADPARIKSTAVLCNVGLDSDVLQTWSVKCPAVSTWRWETDRQKRVAVLQPGEDEDSDFHTARGLLLFWILLIAAAWWGCFGLSKQRFEWILHQD